MLTENQIKIIKYYDLQFKSVKLFNYHIWPICRNDLLLRIIRSEFCDYTENNVPKVSPYNDKLMNGNTHVLFYLEDLYLTIIQNNFVDRVCHSKIKSLISINQNLIFFRNNYLLGKKIFTCFCYFLSFIHFLICLITNFRKFRLIFSFTNCFYRFLPCLLYTLKTFYKLCIIHTAANKIQDIVKKNKILTFYTSNYYNTPNYCLLLAFNRCNLVTYSIQHGNQSYFHPAFHPFNNVPSNGFEVVPKHFICNDNKSTESIQLWNPKFHSTIIENQYFVSRDSSSKNSSFTILVTLQPRLGIMPNLIVETIRLSTRYPILWKIRPHPRFNFLEVNNNYNSFNNCIVCDPSKSDIHTSLSSCNLHITGFSSSFIDANSIGIKTFFIDKRALSYYKNYNIDSFLFQESKHLLSRILKEVNQFQT